MLVFAITTLLTLVGLGSAMTLADCWIRGRYTLESLQEERALLDAGFLPMPQPIEQRVRQSLRFEALAMPSHLTSHLTGHRTGHIKTRVPVERLAANRPTSRPELPAPGVA